MGKTILYGVSYTSCFCVTHQMAAKSQMTERHRGKTYMKHYTEGSLEETVIHIHASPTKDLSNVACLLRLSERLLQPCAPGLITNAGEWDFSDYRLTESQARPN